MFHVKHYHVKHFVLYKIINAKGTQRQKIDIRLLVYVRISITMLVLFWVQHYNNIYH